MAITPTFTAKEEAEILGSLSVGIKATETLVGDAVQVAIKSWSKSAIEVVNKILQTRKSSGDLSQSVAPLPVLKEGDKYVIEIQANDYYDFINEGVNGTEQNRQSIYSFKYNHPSEKMVTSIKEWIPGTGMKIGKHTSAKGTEYTTETYEQLAYIVARSVVEKGIKATPFMDEAFGEASQKALADAVLFALGRAVEIEFTQLSDKYNKK